MMSFTLIAVCSLAAATAYIIWLIYYQHSYWKIRKMLHLKLIPVIGNNAPVFFRTTAIPYHIKNLYNNFPRARYYGMFDFKSPIIILRDPELIRDVCIKNFDSFVDHDAFVTEEMDPMAGRNLFSLKDQRWRDVRSKMSPSFTASRMKLMFELIAECSHDFTQYFLDHPEVAKSFHSKDAFSRYASDVIATAAYGVKFNAMSEEGDEFFWHGKNALSFSFTGAIKFELLRYFTKIMRFFGATFLPRKTDRFFKNMIKETVRIRQERGIIRQDMIDLLMQEMNKKDGVKVTVDDIMGQAFFFFLAGFETSSSLMCFICHELAANPDIQEKLYQEIADEIAKNDDKLTYDGLSKMKYLDMVVSETLRKYPVAPFTNRRCTENYKFPPPMEGYSEYYMKKGNNLIIPIIGLHHDPKYYPEPEKFDPERFSDENKSKIVPYTYMPFGMGPRQCIGNRFVLMECKIVVADLLRKFVIKFTEKSNHPVVFSLTNFTVTAKGGCWLELVQRKKSN